MATEEAKHGYFRLNTRNTALRGLATIVPKGQLDDEKGKDTADAGS